MMKMTMIRHALIASVIFAIALQPASAIKLSELKNAIKSKSKTTKTSAPKPEKSTVVISQAVSSIPIEKQLDEGLNGYESMKTKDYDAPVVYFTRNISPTGLVKLYRALGFAPGEKTAVRINSGEPPRSNYLRQELISSLVNDEIKGTLVDSNAAIGGCRKSSYMHRQVLKDHRLMQNGGFQILDEDGTVKIPVTGGTNLKYIYAGSHFYDYDSYVVLTHFSGDRLTSFYGAMTSLALGFSSGALSKESGKALIYSGGKISDGTFADEEAEDKAALHTLIQECTAEAAKAFYDEMTKKGGVVFINVMSNLSADSDDYGTPEKSEMNAIGICASLDPLAIDQACIDMIFTTAETEGNSPKKLIERIESYGGRHMLEHAQKINLAGGKRTYRLESIE